MSTKPNLSPELHGKLAAQPIVGVLVANDPAAAVSACQALLRGGVASVELALRTQRAFECIEAVVKEVPELQMIAGTVLTTGQLDDLKSIGVTSAVSPGMNRKVVEYALARGMSFAPGICTPSDIEAAVECGCTTLKYFPAEPSGGLSMLKSMAGPYKHLGLDFIPLGGIRESHLEEYLKLDLVLAIGGSWICPSDLVDAGNWDEIESRARGATQTASRIRGA